MRAVAEVVGRLAAVAAVPDVVAEAKLTKQG